MISMQRSLSSPVRIHSTPPASPTVTHLSSRSPTPSPEQHVEVSRPRRHHSPSPSHASDRTAPLPLRPSGELPRRSTGQQQSSSSHGRKAVIAQPATTSASSSRAVDTPGADSTSLGSSPPASTSDAASSVRLKPLLDDVSQYTNPHLSQDAPENESTTLEELAHLVRLSKYQERKRANTRIRLQRSLISTALSARLTRCGEIARKNLAECFRTDDKKTFASLYNAVHDVRKSCDETRRYALLEPDLEALQSAAIGSSGSLDTPTGSVIAGSATATSVAPFLNEISATAREEFLNFLTQIRTNPDFLATRICSLNASELASITNFHQNLEAIESVLPYYSRNPGKGPGGSANRPASHLATSVERLLSFQRHDPLSALIYTCFANSAGPDSAEDRRRTDAWATACARLAYDPKNGSEQVIILVLNVWAAMRDWAGKSNLEWYLMKILEDGAFIINRPEDERGTRFHLNNWTQKDQIAAEEFFDQAMDDLFDVIDDEDGTGIPEGLLELGNQILRKLDGSRADTTRKWLVNKWLFSVWLTSVIIHPESYGMMTDYYFTEYGRQKILKTIATRAAQYVDDLLGTMAKQQPASVPLKVKAHVENILGRFRGSRSSRTTARLLPARSITSLRETAEVRPYLVVSPADLVTMVNTLFPERRPHSARSGSLRSGAPSVSGFSAISQPIMMTPSRNNFETASVMSTSLSSTFSDATTSREPLMEEQPAALHRFSNFTGQPGGQRPNNYEDQGIRLRMAVQEMTQVLSMDVVCGSCHPCAERWSVLFISADGNSLSLQMTYDPDEDVEEENSSTTESEDDGSEQDRPELDKDYHQLRDSVLRLVQDFEIPQSIEPKSQTFSNRASGLKKYRLKNKVITTEKSMGSRNPYRHLIESKKEEHAATENQDPSSARPSSRGTDAPGANANQSEPQSVLHAMLMAAYAQSNAQSDFVSAIMYWRTLQQLNTVTSPSLRRNGFATLLNIFSRGPRDSIRRSAAAIEEYDAWLVWLKQSQERAEGLNDGMIRRIRALRDKMWYVSDVRNSAQYEDSKSIAEALKSMAAPRRWGSFHRTARARGSAASYLFQKESQMVDLLAASDDHGGPNKLSDDQAEKTARWMRQSVVQNYCMGEERIHRLCCEVETCINKLIGSKLSEGPVLWSSELYQRDRRYFESTKASREGYFGGSDDAVSTISDPERRFNSLGRNNALARELRGMSAHNSSQHSFDSGRYNASRASTVLSDILDSQDYFGISSPVYTIDSSTTFWSPFQSTVSPPLTATSRPHSPTTSITNLSSSFSQPFHQNLPSQTSLARPTTAISLNETVYQQRLADDKTRFLAELRPTLTSLLLSDLGTDVFSMGAETDAWFQTLGQECIERREAVERRARHVRAQEKRKPTKSILKQRVIEKKRSFGDLRGVGGGEQSPSLEKADVYSQHSQSTETPASTGNGREGSVASNETVTGRSGHSRKTSTPEFPFTKAYQRLLKMFCVHPSPYVKLNVLCELEHLIEASLASGGSRRRLARLARTSDFGTSSSSGGDEYIATMGGRAKPLEDVIDTIRERRSHTLQQPFTLNSPTSPSSGRGGGNGGMGSLNAETRSIMASQSGNTDAVVKVLQSLFRDPNLRPKTLFRDLQFIAAFVPSSVLDKPERGKAFWDTGLAALSLKQEVCMTMVELADEIVKVYTEPRRAAVGGGGSSRRAGSTASDRSSSTIAGPETSAVTVAAAAEGSRSTSVSLEARDKTPSPLLPPAILPLPSTYTLADAARMWTITAKEGDATSQRELALFYLSNPELIERTTLLPLSRPREVFKQALVDKYGAGVGGAAGSASSGVGSGAGARIGVSGVGGSGIGMGAGGDGAPGSSSGPGHVGAGSRDVRSDPGLMCVAIHWMREADRGGDELARAFLRQHELGLA